MLKSNRLYAHQSVQRAVVLRDWGCCTGSAPADCDVITHCTEGSMMSSKPFETACSGTQPYCAKVLTTFSGSTYTYTACDTVRTSYQILQTPHTTSIPTSTGSTVISEISTDSHTQSGPSTAATTTQIQSGTKSTAARSPKPTAGAGRMVEAMLGVAGLAGLFAMFM
ncbi:hypothetical protein K491DRAFT_197849 [Lophiostoma macrostomum CBS 122681]|uniref:Uncharacterized protein n=1 Tax=Lophiostoma macrostomum CBS 122681 TaxID=1314788 RepID=A0A6A6SRD2_9PLEO|nr:hypothetical protein K491DRAFT_197849 [Lophiostoma macrostomum CBS 122681]